MAGAIYIKNENKKIELARIERERELKEGMTEYEKNVYDINAVVKQGSSDVINVRTLRKSLKMSFDLYRGGTFDFSNIPMCPVDTKDISSVSYPEVVKFLNTAVAEDLIYINDNFNDIQFKKAFFTPMVQIPQVYDNLMIWDKILQKDPDEELDLFDPRNISEHDWVKQTKENMINYGIESIWNFKERGHWLTWRKTNLNDFDFYSENDKEERDIQDLVSEENYHKYFRYEMKSGELKTFEEIKEEINKLTKPDEIISYIKTLSAPVVKFNLDNRFLIKFNNVDENEIKINHKSSSNSGEAVDVNINNWDPVFGVKNSWYQYKSFQSNYYQKNVISPMFLIDDEKVKIVRNDATEFSIYEDQVLGLSESYSMPMSYEQIINYDSSEHQFFNNSKNSIKLNENRYFENKLHNQQSAIHGFNAMSDVDMYNETMTGNWYPHIRQEYATMWQYMTKFVQWGWKSTWPTPLQIDTAHKNGVEIYGTVYNDSPSSMIVRLLADTEEGRFIWADNLIKIMQDTGVDGVFWNAEISGWGAISGISIGAASAWQRLTNYLDDALQKVGKKLLIYGNYNTELPRTPNDYIKELKDGNDDYNYGSSTYWTRGLVPSNGEAEFYHLDENFNILDKPLGYAHKNGMNDLYLSFIDKDHINGVEENEYADKYGHDISFAKERNEFAQNNPEYNLIVLGSDSIKDSTRNFMQREMDFLSKEGLATEYYADFMMFADGAGVVDPRDKFEWEMSQYIARTNKQIAVGHIDGTDGGYTSQNDYKLSGISSWYGKGDWEQLSQDPRSESWAYSNYFQERSTIDDRDFYTAFNVGYGHNYTLNGESIYGDWQNIGFQDFYPTYRYIIDVYDKDGHLIDDSANNYTKRKVNAYIDEVSNAYQGNDALHYKGTLDKNESFINKLYVSNITKDKEFSIFVKNDDDLQTTLQVWRNKQEDAEEVRASKTETVNGYKKLTFNVSATDANKITSFGLKVQNTSVLDKPVDLENYRVGAISFVDPSKQIKDHSNVISSFYAETNNIDDIGINVKFEDQYFDENTRYVIYNEENKPVAISSRPEFHVNHGGSYTIKVFNPIGDSLGSYQIHLNEIIKN